MKSSAWSWREVKADLVLLWSTQGYVKELDYVKCVCEDIDTFIQTSILKKDDWWRQGWIIFPSLMQKNWGISRPQPSFENLKPKVITPWKIVTLLHDGTQLKNEVQ